MTGADRGRLDDMLVARAVEGLDADDEAELQELLRAGAVDPDGYDEAAAWFWLGAGDPPRGLPPRVAGRVRQALDEHAGSGSETPPPRPPPPDSGARAPRRGAGRIPAPSAWSGAMLGWIAAGVAFVLAAAGWWPQLEGGAGPAPEELAAARAELMATAPDAVRIEWQHTDAPRADGVSGYVVWSDRRQRGFMTFRGIPPNDPSEYQYQVWVYDQGRPGRLPVNGGVFNAPDSGDEVIVPIESKLPITRAEQFAITREPPGGVVVTDRDSPLLLARPATASST